MDEINLNVGNTEKGAAALTLGVLTSLNPEARRRLLKVARRHPNVMHELKYSNDVIHLDLVNEWKHYKQLRDMIDDQETFSLTDRSVNKFKTNFIIDKNQNSKHKYFHHILV